MSEAYPVAEECHPRRSNQSRKALTGAIRFLRGLFSIHAEPLGGVSGTLGMHSVDKHDISLCLTCLSFHGLELFMRKYEGRESS